MEPAQEGVKPGAGEADACFLRVIPEFRKMSSLSSLTDGLN